MKNGAYIPKTSKLMEVINLLTKGLAQHALGITYFSLMTPGTHVKAHNGPNNLRIRCHLGLQNPDGDKVRLRVGEEWRTWKDGEMYCFDDSFEHEVFHDGTKDRLVFIVDIWHPDLFRKQIYSLHRWAYSRNKAMC